MLGAGVLAAPLGWALQLTLNYGLTYPAYDWQSKLPLHLVSLAAALSAVFSFGVGWHGLWRSRLGAAVDAAERERVRFMSVMACGAGAFFLLAVLAQSVPAVMLALGVRI